MQSAAWDLARGLARDGVDVTAVTTGVPERADAFECDGVSVVPLRGTRPGRYSRSWWRRSRAYVQRHLLESAGAVISVSAGAYGLLGLRKTNPAIPFLLQVHGTSFGEVLSKLRTRRVWDTLTAAKNVLGLPRDLWAYSRFDWVVAVGETVASDLRRPPASWVIAPRKVRLIPIGIDGERFAPDRSARERVRRSFGWGDGARVVVTVSRLHRQKGLDRALRGFATYARRAPQAWYCIVGEGPERHSLESLAHELGVADRVMFTGAVDRPAVTPYLQAGDVFLFATHHREGLPLTVLEALASGLPCVVSEHLGNVAALSPEVHLTAMDDTRALSGALIRVLARSRPTTSLLPEAYTLSQAIRSYRDLLEL